jgi:hypothetical protein
MRCSIFASSALCLVLSFASPLAAQPTASGKAAAEALFQEGAELFTQGDVARACERFGASQDLDPGLGTMLRLADCLDRLGKTASAWALFREAAAIAGERGDSDREAISNQRASDLDQRLTRLSLTTAESTAPPGFSVELNGVVIPVTSLGIPLPVDPGPLTIEARADGRRPFSGSIEIPAGPGSSSFEIPALEREHVKPQPPERSPALDRAAAPEQSSSLRTVGFVSAGVGLLGLAAGGVLAYRAVQLRDDSLGSCQKNDPNSCSKSGYEKRQDSLAAADAATLSFGIGGALLLGGVVLVLFAPSSSEPRAESRTATLAVTAAPIAEGGTLRLGGTF